MKRMALISKLDLAVLLGVAVSVLLANIAVFGQECTLVRSDVVRLHIMADSDREADQAVKLRVRDRILADVGDVFAGPHSQQDAKKTAKAHLDEIKAAAEAELAACGVDAPVRVELCNMYFTTRQYEQLFLPAGNYDAVRVTIGSGNGKNWWCVMYPPICVPAANAETREFLDESAEMGEILELNNEPLFKPKLAIVELFEGIFKENPDHPAAAAAPAAKDAPPC